MKKLNALNLASKICFHTSFVLFALSATATPILLGNAGIINTNLGIATQIGGGSSEGSTYYNTKFKSLAEVKEASLKLIEESTKEGAVLLKNDILADGNKALPLAKGNKVTLYGAASYHSVITGMGSSSIKYDLKDRVRLSEGLKNAGLVVNEDLDNFYKENGLASLGSNHFTGYEDQETQIVVKDMAWDSLPDSKNEKADAAIMVIARNSGEAIDMYMDTTMDDDKTRVVVSRDHNGDPTNSVGDSLRLSDNEKDVLNHLKELKKQGTIGRIVVLLNLANPIQTDFITSNDSEIDACMWVGDLGHNGASAVGKLLVGDYNPSGKTSDTFFNNSKYNPVYYNFGSVEYKNSDLLKNYFATRSEYNNKFYVTYQEGIYNGYKYSETRYEDIVTGRENSGEFDYTTAIGYPFGYGLSYSSFEYNNFKVKEKDSKTYTVTLDVKNVGKVDGKEAVQIYLQKPYTQKDIENGVEKASAELIGYDKVFVEAGKTESVSIDVKKKYFAAYDANVEKTYVIGSKNKNDKYLLTAAKDSHDAVNNFLKYKANNGYQVDNSKVTTLPERNEGNASLVWSEYFSYDNKNLFN